MAVTNSFRKLLLVSTACAFFAACSDTSISSPGDENLGTPPGGGGTPPPSGTTVDLVGPNGCGDARETTITVDNIEFETCEITGNILTDATLPAGSGYAVTGPVFVGQDGGASATLTIEPGAILWGNAGSDYIVISRGSQIDAQGTATSPIIMTARGDADVVGANDSTFGATTRGQWGGLIINGFAPINACIGGNDGTNGGTAACEKSGEGSSGLFGGGNPNDDSGTLRYVQVRYAGFLINNQDELNGIAFQGVGDGTDVEFIQVHNNADDGVEFFGGTVNVKHVALTGNADDSLDWTDGWTGSAQFVLVKQSRDDADQGFEMDNRSSNNTFLPRSNPSVSNFTIIGERNAAESDIGMLLRAGTAGEFFNGIVVDMGEDCLDIDDAETFGRLGASDAAGDEDIKLVSMFLDCTTEFDEEASDPVDLSDFFFAQSPNNATGANTMNGVFPGPTEQGVTAVTPTTVDGRFRDTNQQGQTVNYIGAFGPQETSTSNWASFTDFIFADPGCPQGTTESTEVIDGQRVCQLTGNVLNDVRLTNNNIYEVIGPVFVGVDLGPDADNLLPSGVEATLTIDPGVTLFGSSGSDYIVITRGSQIISNGTQFAPVVMTARADVEGTIGATERGQWGGLVINGRAPINACIGGNDGTNGGTVDCEKSGEGSSGLFGGEEVNDDSGQLFYTQVRYAGFLINNQDELNGIAFQGVGDRTEVDFIQVMNNADDGVEFFGGTVDASHIVLTGNADDSLDWTDGWVGNAQYIIVQQYGDDADQGFEMDNRSSNNTFLPRSNPNIANFTIIGERGAAESDIGMLLRAGTAGSFMNGLIVDMGEDCIDVDDAETFNRIGASGAPGDEDITITYTRVDCTTNFDEEGGDPVDLSTWFLGQTGNSEYTTTLGGFTFNPNTTTGVVPGANEAGAAGDPSTMDAFFDNAPYYGAVEDANDTWFQGWTFQRTQ
jgi:hypothetical protein